VTGSPKWVTQKEGEASDRTGGVWLGGDYRTGKKTGMGCGPIFGHEVAGGTRGNYCKDLDGEGGGLGFFAVGKRIICTKTRVGWSGRMEKRGN